MNRKFRITCISNNHSKEMNSVFSKEDIFDYSRKNHQRKHKDFFRSWPGQLLVQRKIEFSLKFNFKANRMNT